MALGWKRQQYTIRFRISDFFLFGIRRETLVRQTHFSAPDAAMQSLELPLDAFSQGIELLYVPSVPGVENFPDSSRKDGLLRYCLRRYRRHFIRIEGSFADYLAKFSSKSRGTLKRKAAQWNARNHSQPGMRVYHQPNQMEEYVRLARRVSARTYQELISGDGFPSHPEFAAELARLAADKLVRGYVLLEGERPVAYAHCQISPQAPNVLLYDTVGYDPDDRAWSPGTVLLYRILEELHHTGAYSVFDFGIGDHDYKRFFATGSTEVVDLLCFPNTLANRALVTAHHALRRLSAAAGWLAASLGLAAGIKRWFRFHQAHSPAHTPHTGDSSPQSS